MMNALARIGLTRALAERARCLRFEDIPETVRVWGRQCVLDYAGCAVAGASDELVGILLAEMQEHGGAPVAGVFGRSDRLPVLSAALVNGAASHALDFDDVNLAMPGHPSVAILPALLALAEQRGSAQHDSGVPAEDVTHQGQRLEAKFAALVDPVLGMERSARLIAGIGRLDTLGNVSGLIAAGAPA
jgi:2-methylcitrate dehydratase PrpD